MKALSTLSNAVKAKIQKLFRPEDHERVARLLVEYGFGQEIERVHLDILEIYDSNLEKVSRLVQLANHDYRDLIVAAEYDDVDGELVLKPPSRNRGNGHARSGS